MENKILIAGAGAMGLSFAHKLKNENKVYLVDTWKENVEAIKKHGYEILDVDKVENAKIDIFYPEEFNEKVDLIILFVKSMNLENMLKLVEKNISENTKVLCLLNGLGHIDTLKKYVKEENIVVGVSLMTASMLEAAKAKCTSYGYNEISNEKVANLINSSGIESKYKEKVLESIWIKACLNGVYNSLCTILDVYMGELSGVLNLDEIFVNIVDEFHSVALHENVDFDKNLALTKIRACIDKNAKAYYHYPSMHQDLIQKNRPTEIDFLNGYISRKSKEYGIKTPFCDLITFQVKVLEKKLIK